MTEGMVVENKSCVTSVIKSYFLTHPVCPVAPVVSIAPRASHLSNLVSSIG